MQPLCPRGVVGLGAGTDTPAAVLQSFEVGLVLRRRHQRGFRARILARRAGDLVGLLLREPTGPEGLIGGRQLAEVGRGLQRPERGGYRHARLAGQPVTGRAGAAVAIGVGVVGPLSREGGAGLTKVGDPSEALHRPNRTPRVEQSRLELAHGRLDDGDPTVELGEVHAASS